MIERTLILLKPDAVQRGLIGRIIQRFEDAGFKIVAMKMVWVDEDFAKKHYFDLGERRGIEVLKRTVDFITQGPIVAMVIEGSSAVENVRKMVGSTEPKSAQPGTIRGDFSHMSYQYSDSKGKSVPNVIHASGSKKDAEYEINLWFKPEEIHSYKTVHEIFVR